MSSKVKSVAVHLPLAALLILDGCACSLAAHYIRAGLAPSDGRTGFDRAAQAYNRSCHPLTSALLPPPNA